MRPVPGKKPVGKARDLACDGRMRAKLVVQVAAVWLASSLPFVALGCPKADEKPTSKDDEKSKKKKGDDDDDEGAKKKKTKKKEDDEGDDTTKKAPDDDEARKGGSKPVPDDSNPSDRGRGGEKINVIDPTTPVPPGCAPADIGKLGAKPKYLTSAGQPGASLAVWASATDTQMKGPFAMTIAADGRCYVHYEKVLMEDEDVGAVLRDVKFDKGAIQATNGIDEKGSTFVGFRVAYTSTWLVKGATITQNEVAYLGYVSAGSVPYSCGPIAGEPKSDKCAMYHTPLHVFEKETCVSPTAKGGPTNTPTASPSAAPTAGASASASPSASASAGAAGDVCGPDPGCDVKSTLVKEPKHTYMRVSAGARPHKCVPSRQPIAPRVGDSWYFDGNHWTKR